MGCFVIAVHMLLVVFGQIHCQTTETGTATINSGRSEITTGAPPASTSTVPREADSCNGTSLSVSAGSVADFRDVVDQGAIFVYAKLAFADAKFNDSDAAYLEDRGNIINPLRWVWAKSGKGKLLLSSPFDFYQLSLTTLGTGVFSVEFKINGCFDTGDGDEDKIEAIAKLLQDVAKDVDNKTDEEMLICLEKQLGREELDLPGASFYYFPVSSYTMMQASTAFDCWLGAGETDTTERLVPTQYWLVWIFAGGFVLALFSPMAMSFFIQKNPPEIDSAGKKRISLVSDLPLGLKYVLCFWRNDTKHFFVSSTRWTVFILLFTLIQYIPLIVSALSDMDDFAKRHTAFYQSGPINAVLNVVWHVLVNVIFVVAAIVFLTLSGQEFLELLLRERERSRSVASQERQENSRERAQGGQGESIDVQGASTTVAVDGATGDETREDGEGAAEGGSGAASGEEDPGETNVAYKYMVLVKAPDDLQAPATPLDNSQAFFYYMTWRAKMGLRIKVWKFVFYDWLWSRISESVGAPNHPRTLLCAIIFVILYPLYLPLAAIFFGFNCLPLLYCMTRCIQTILTDVTFSELMRCFLFAIASIAWFFKTVATFVYIAELLGYSFMGFVVNAEAVGPTVLVVGIFAGYVVTAITSFYEGYCSLFKGVMEIAEETDKDAKERRADASTPVIARSTDQPHGSGDTFEMTPLIQGAPSGHTPLIKINASDTPTMELDLFWALVEKYRPIRVQVASTFFELLVVVVAIGFGLSILFIADSLSELSTTVELFSSVIIAGVVPTAILALRSPASQSCYETARQKQIKADVVHFAKNGKIKEYSAS